MKNVFVSDVMSRNPICVKKDTSLRECAKKMMAKRIRGLPIVEDGKLIGIISQRDILWAVVKKSYEDLSLIKAIDISPKKIETIKASSLIQDAINKMKKCKLDKLPVVQDNVLVGMITLKDILNFHTELYPELEEFAIIKEEEAKLRRAEKNIPNFDSANEGICEECGERDILYSFNGMLICESCKESI